MDKPCAKMKEHAGGPRDGVFQAWDEVFQAKVRNSPGNAFGRRGGEQGLGRALKYLSARRQTADVGEKCLLTRGASAVICLWEELKGLASSLDN